MNYLICAFGIALIQVSNAQVFSYVPRNAMQANIIHGNQVQNSPRNINPTIVNANRQTLARPLPYANYNANSNMINANIANTNIANAQLANTQVANAEREKAKYMNTQLLNAELANAKIINAELANANFANTQLATAELADARFANAQITNSELANANFANSHLANADQANARIMRSNRANRNIANVISNSNIELANMENNNANLANIASGFNPGFLANLASLNGNMATFNLGNGGQHTFTVTSGSPNSPGFGIQLIADALEVGGTVAVNGQVPIYGTVAVNGHLPTDGTASVNYSSGRPVSV